MLRWSRNDETSDHRGPLGDVFYLVGNAVVGLIVGRLVVDAWQPLIALVAATLASAGSWKGWLPGTQKSRDPNEG